MHSIMHYFILAFIGCSHGTTTTTVTVIDSCNKFHWSLKGCLQGNDTILEFGAWISVRAFARETFLFQSLSYFVNGS